MSGEQWCEAQQSRKENLPCMNKEALCPRSFSIRTSCGHSWRIYMIPTCCQAFTFFSPQSSFPKNPYRILFFLGPKSNRFYVSFPRFFIWEQWDAAEKQPESKQILLLSEGTQLPPRVSQFMVTLSRTHTHQVCSTESSCNHSAVAGIVAMQHNVLNV